MSDQAKTDAAPQRELSVTRHIKAPPALVWRILTERQAEWFCPRPWRFELVSRDARPGGREVSIIHGPNGEAMHSEGLILAWEPERRYVATDAISGDFWPQEPFMIGFFTIEPDGAGGVHYRAGARHWSDEAMQRHREMGFDEGWNIVADQLKALCESEAEAA